MCLKMHISMKLESVIRKEVCNVDLTNVCSPLGVTVGDGFRGELCPVVKRIKPKSFASRCHAFSEGDVILAVNGKDVFGRCRKDVQAMLKESAPNVNLKLLHEIHDIGISGPGVYKRKQMTTRLEKIGDNFGFCLRWKHYQTSLVVEYPVISNIKRGGPADVDGLMLEGDKLLKVDEFNLSWLSQSDIDHLLRDRSAAEFTFEYNVRLHDSSKLGNRRIDLDVQLPFNVNLGIRLSPAYSSDFHFACIDKIETCSVAERCGIFNAGDLIVSINHTSVQCLAVSQATLLLKAPDKIRKLSFISRGKDVKQRLRIENCIRSKECPGSESSDEVENGHRHLNTPASSNATTSGNQNSKPINKLCYRQQIKAVRKFHDVVKLMTQLKEFLSQLVVEAFDSKENPSNFPENCTACKQNHPSVNLCASCLSKTNVKCAQSMDILKDIIAHFISFSLKLRNVPALMEKANIPAAKDRKMKDSVPKNLVYSLTETLPQFFAEKPDAQSGSFRALAEKITKADTSCSTCHEEINFASLTTQKLLLLMSLNDTARATKVLINQLVYCLLETKLPCDAGGNAECPQSSLEEESVTESEHALQMPPCTSSAAADFESSSSETRQYQETEFYDVNLDESPIDNNDVRDDGNPDFPVKVDLSRQSAYFKQFDIESISGSETSPELGEIVNIGGCRSKVDKNIAVQSEHINFESPASHKPTKHDRKKIYKDKSLLSLPTKIWSSLDSFVKTKKSPSVENKSKTSSKPCGSKDFLDIPKPPSINVRDLMSRSSAKYANAKDFESNPESTRSSVKELLASRKGDVKIHKETAEVKMTNDGEGFGFVLGFCSRNFSETLPLPIITAIKPKSPAHKSGILAKNDRVLAINGQSVVGMPLKDLENLKRVVFSSSSISLLIEFDVVDVELQFGIFDVVLDKTLTVGLLFEDMKKGRSMTVTGVVKGSAAHRSGQLFPRDQVVFLKCVRNEVFNPITCSYNKEEFVKLTVKRERREGITESPINSSQANPFSAGPSSSQTGVKFQKSKSVRTGEGSGTTVLDHRLTLFRDPVSWDFGFLVGENPFTGLAYVTDIKPDGPASASGVMQRMDRIVEVNGITVGKDEDCSVLSLLTQANDKVDLLIRRPYHRKTNAPRQPQKHDLPPFL